MGNYSFPIKLMNKTSDRLQSPRPKRRDYNEPISDLEYQGWVRIVGMIYNKIIPGMGSLFLKIASPGRSDYLEWTFKTFKAKTGLELSKIKFKKKIKIPIRIRIRFLPTFIFLYYYRIRHHTFHSSEKRFKEIIRHQLERFTPLILDTVTKESLSIHQHRISSDIDFEDKAALQNEVMNIAYNTCLRPPPVRKGEPGTANEPWDSCYPEFSMRAKKWRAMLGIKENDTLSSGLRHMLFTIFIKDTFQVIRLKSVKGSRISDKTNYMIAGHISHTKGYNKGRTPELVKKAEQEGLVHRVQRYDEQESGERIVNYDVEDIQANHQDSIEYKLLLQQITQLVTDDRDKIALQIYYQIAQGSTLEHAFTLHETKCRELGLSDSSAIRKRLERIPRKYPKVRALNPFRDN